jgi:hypothetical protein
MDVPRKSKQLIIWNKASRKEKIHQTSAADGVPHDPETTNNTSSGESRILNQGMPTKKIYM